MGNTEIDKYSLLKNLCTICQYFIRWCWRWYVLYIYRTKKKQKSETSEESLNNVHHTTDDSGIWHHRVRRESPRRSPKHKDKDERYKDKKKGKRKKDSSDSDSDSSSWKSKMSIVVFNSLTWLLAFGCAKHRLKGLWAVVLLKWQFKKLDVFCLTFQKKPSRKFYWIQTFLINIVNNIQFFIDEVS